MLLDLKGEVLFESDELNFNKNITFIYGKNGTGKSTLTDIIEKQCSEYDVRVFKGFENVIGSNNRLNAVVLGEENTSIRIKIEKIEKQIQELNVQRDAIRKELEQPADNTISNYWTRNRKAYEEYEKKEEILKKWYTKTASEIKKKNNPQVSSTNYDMRAFKKDIPNAVLLSEKEMQQCIEILKSEPKKAKDVSFPNIGFSELVSEVNSILQYKVEEKVKISRLENNVEKRNFADMGRKLHKKGDVCAFCGTQIKDSVLEELESYFSADEVKAFREKINRKIESVAFLKESIKQLEIDEKEFYLEFEDEVLQLKKAIEEIKKEQIVFLNYIEKELNNKLACLFEFIDVINMEIPIAFHNSSVKYDELKIRNNDNSLTEKQEEAKEKLRLHFVKEQLELFDYSAVVAELDVLEKQKITAYKEFEAEKLKITGENGIDSQIAICNNDVAVLQNSTRNEKLLAQNINDKLRYMVSFELVHCEDEDEKGYYQVENIHTREKRDITQLSTGEKNIIAFLYFIEKLKEIQEGVTECKPKFIVFDDPMNSNDDNMQYLIIEELHLLMRKIKGDDRFVLLTHNNHFYLNVKFTFKYKDNLFIHLQSNGDKTSFITLTKEDEDFNTSYQSLWKEMVFLYNNADATPVLMLNPMRRIIETYTKFNALNKNDFCAKKSGALKLFNVNSHSIDDLEADLCGKEKKDIVNIFCDCFNQNGVLDHFKSLWSDYDTSFLELIKEEVE